jgi:predicted adenylyl cyclase CyaB
MKNYEVEIKSLLGSKENADKLKSDLVKNFPKMSLVGKGKQLNHYFNTPKNFDGLRKNILPLIPADKLDSFLSILSHGHKMSIRTRDADGRVIFVVKASLGDDTSSNGVKRIEFEIPVNKSLAELDQLLIDSGCTYQAKWSREREEYGNEDLHVCIDKNAGYGYLAEFEKVINDESKLEQTRNDLLSVMASVEAVELAQDRLERMFAYYNANWPDYYGTDKTFTVQ